MTTHDEGYPHTPLCCIGQVRFDEMDRRMEAKFEALEAAIHKAEVVMNTRLEGMNQFREQILDERASFATRREAVLITFVLSMIMAGVSVVIIHLVTK